MIYSEFRKLLVKKNIQGCYLFYGEETMMIEEIIDYIINSFVNKSTFDLNYTRLSGKTVAVEDLYSSIETLPFMSDYRVVVIEEIDEMYKNLDLGEEFIDFIDSIEKDTIVIFVDTNGGLNKNTRLFRYFKETNRDVSFHKLNNRELIQFIKRELEKNNKTMSYGDISYFILQTGYENNRLDIHLNEVSSELEKLMNYSRSETITKSDIDAVVEKVNDSNIFNLLDMLSRKNQSGALSVLHDLYEKDEPIPIILHMIQRRYRHLYSYVSMERENLSGRDIKRSLKVSDYEYRVISQSGRGLTTCDLRDRLEMIFETEKKLKSTSIDELLLMEYLVIKLSS